MKKRESKYATRAMAGGMEFRSISEEMKRRGWNMTCGSARNWLLRGMRKFASRFASEHGLDLNDHQIDEIARSAVFQQAVGELLERVTYSHDGLAKEDVTSGAASSKGTGPQ